MGALSAQQASFTLDPFTSLVTCRRHMAIATAAILMAATSPCTSSRMAECTITAAKDTLRRTTTQTSPATGVPSCTPTPLHQRTGQAPQDRRSKRRGTAVLVTRVYLPAHLHRQLYYVCLYRHLMTLTRARCQASVYVDTRTGVAHDYCGRNHASKARDRGLMPTPAGEQGVERTLA